MNTIVPEATVNGQPRPFDARIRVAGVIVAPVTLTDGSIAVSIDHGDEAGKHVYSIESACALAAAIQAVAVHQLESMEVPREIRRSTEPGAPSFEEVL